MSDDIKARIEDAFTKGVARAQEWGTKTYITDPSDPTKQVPATGEMKKEMALETARAIEPKVQELPQDVQAAMIDAKLQLLRSALSIPPRTSASIRPPSLPPPAEELTTTGRFKYPKGPVP